MLTTLEQSRALHENLTKAAHDAEFLREDLRAALHDADPVAAMLLLDMIGDAARLADRIAALAAALLDRP